MDPILDTAVIDSLRDMDTDGTLLPELISLLTADVDAALPRMERDVAAGDRVAVAREAHALKSACANLGGMRVSAAFRELERAARAPDAPALAGPLADARAAWELTRPALRSL